MNTFTAALFLVVFVFDFQCLTFAAPTETPRTKNARLLRHDYIKDNNGQFSLYFELDDGTSQYREGSLVPNDEGDGYVLVQRGSYSYISPEGINVKMSYTADKDGFKVVEYSIPPAAVTPMARN